MALIPPGSTRRITSLDVLRGIAISMVLLAHLPFDSPSDWFGYVVLHRLILSGWIGVDLFFVLSGFLLSLPFATASLSGKPPPANARYFKRRLLRVFPAYYAQLIIILLAGAWFVSWKPLGGTSLLAHLLMFFNFGTAPVRPLVGLWWTLPVELSFYLILPLIASFMQPRRWLLFVSGGFVLSILYRIWVSSAFGTIPGEIVFLNASQLPGSLPEFLLGASAAMLVRWVDWKNLKRPSLNTADGLFLAGVVLTVLWLGQIVFTYGAVYWRGHWSMIIAPIALGSALSLMVLGIYWGSRLGKLLCGNPVVYFVGLISYSLYLWHFVVMQQVQMIGGETYAALPGFSRFLICTGLVTALSAISYYLFERPFFKLRGSRKTSP